MSKELKRALSDHKPIVALRSIWEANKTQIQFVMAIDFILAVKSLRIAHLPLPPIDHDLFHYSVLRNPSEFSKGLEQLLRVDPKENEILYEQRYHTGYYYSLTRFLQPQQIHILNNPMRDEELLIELQLDLIFALSKLIGDHISKIEYLLERNFDLASEKLLNLFAISPETERMFLTALFQPEHLRSIKHGVFYKFLIEHMNFDYDLNRIENLDEILTKKPEFRQILEGEPFSFRGLDDSAAKIFIALLQISWPNANLFQSGSTYSGPKTIVSVLKSHENYRLLKLMHQEIFHILEAPLDSLQPHPFVRQFSEPLLLLKEMPPSQWQDNPLFEHLEVDQEFFREVQEPGYRQLSIVQLLRPYLRD